MNVQVELNGAETTPEAPGVERLVLDTNLGEVVGRFRGAEGEDAVLWVFGAGGGLGGPAGGVYERVGETLAGRGVASLELDFRKPGDLRDCVIDVLVGVAWLEHQGKSQVALVGHSFGGAVVINAARMTEAAAGVAALSTQTFGAEEVHELAPLPILFVHGEDDEVLPDEGARTLYAAAGEPKTLITYPDCGHGLDECREDLDRDLTRWFEQVFELEPPSA